MLWFAIPSYSPFQYFLRYRDFKKQKLRCEWAGEIKNMINYHFKGLYKTICYRIKYKFSQFFFPH